MVRLRLRLSTIVVAIPFVLIAIYLYRKGTSGHLQSDKQERHSPVHVGKHPTARPRVLPPIQYAFDEESGEEKATRTRRQAAVKESFQRAWKSYTEKALAADELAPISGGRYTTFGGWAATLVDSLDTLWIMGMRQEFELAIETAASIEFNTTAAEEINVFETTIRYLGGFLGAYDISGGAYPILLQKAKEVGDFVYRSFDTPNRMPVTRWRWRDTELEALDDTCSAEIGSLTLEFTRLTQLTGDSKYYDAVYTVMQAFERSQMSTHIPGLWPVIVNARKLTFGGLNFGLGGMADSLYEYLPKEYMLLGGNAKEYKTMYERALRSATQNLFFKPMLKDGNDILVSGGASFDQGKLWRDPQGQHLVAFVPGMMAIAAKLFGREAEGLAIARKLLDGCIWAYDSMPSGIMPEIFHLVPCGDPNDCPWDEAAWLDAVRRRHGVELASPTAAVSSDDKARALIKQMRLPPGYTGISDRRYILRPETIESVFVLYRVTGDKSLLDTAWRMFVTIEKHTKTDLANAELRDVTVEHPEKMDKMESFWLAETLKYFYLVFSEPDAVSLDKYVLNTEAHPLLRPT